MSPTWSRSSTERIFRAGLVMGLALGTGSAEAVTSPVQGDPRYQTELPYAAPAAGSPSHGGGSPTGRDRSAPGGEAPGGFGEPASGTVGEPSGDAGLGTVLETLAPGLTWLILAALLIGIVLVIVQWVVARRRPDPAISPPAAEPTPLGAPRSPDLGADRLAAEGRWAEALQAVLREVLRTLAERFRVPLPTSRTSREALRALPLQGASREALGELVAAVERAIFGRAAVGAEGYRHGLDLARVALGRRPGS